ncbi:uncharacterized protein LOC119987121 isoform X2 [Tripterygium wilfordii]|uniref:uncharacterized protein LOC119987121 isoform X2 n=1 Tax=Tripterygium wilfordii TaxID=458696 RepID=UPI0018F7F853|nr:uncharacterized protein LOC119987121 isoform X2 [Tripterygium wilfordii]
MIYHFLCNFLCFMVTGVLDLLRMFGVIHVLGWSKQLRLAIIIIFSIHVLIRSYDLDQFYFDVVKFGDIYTVYLGPNLLIYCLMGFPFSFELWYGFVLIWPLDPSPAKIPGACPREFSWKPSVLRAWWGETFFPKNPVSSFFSSFQLHVLQILSHAYFSSSFFPFSCRKEHHSWALRFRSLRGCTQYLSMNSERNNTVNNVQLSSTQFMLLLWLLDLMQMWPTASMHLPDGYQRHITGNSPRRNFFSI